MTSTQKLFSKLMLWFILEITLTLLNLDNLADYSEFLNRSFNFRQAIFVEAVRI